MREKQENERRGKGLKQYIADRRLAAVSLVLGVLMGLMILLGIRYSRNELIYRTAGQFLGQLAGWVVCMTVMVWAICVGLDALGRGWFKIRDFQFGKFLPVNSYQKRTQARREKDCEDQGSSRDVESQGRESKQRAAKNSDLGTWLKWMFLSWCVYLPVFLAVYPGIYSYDASAQLLQFYGKLPLTTHHPLIHTLYLGLCMKIAGRLFHTYQAGMALYALSQSFFMSAVFSLCLCRMKARRAPRWLCVASWTFWILNPYLTVFSFVTTKDVLFGAFFLLAFDAACCLAEDPEHFWRGMCQKKEDLDKERELDKEKNPNGTGSRKEVGKTGDWLLFFVSVFFMCLFRNQGIYVFLFFVLAVCLFLRKKVYRRNWFIGASLLVAALWYVLSGPIPTAFGVGKGDAREMLCVPMQQLARIYHEVPEKLAPEEKEYIETLIDPQALSEYVRVNADPVKSGFHTEVMQADMGRFVRTWAEIGKRHPDIYLDSFLMGNWGYWYIGDNQYWISYILYDGAYLEDDLNILHITRNSHFQALSDWLREATLTPAFQSVPMLSVLLNQAFPFWLMLFAAGFAVWKRRAYEILPMMLLLGCWGTLLLGPVVSLRYALPLIYCVPRLLEMIVGLTGKR